LRHVGVRTKIDIAVFVKSNATLFPEPLIENLVESLCLRRWSGSPRYVLRRTQIPSLLQDPPRRSDSSSIGDPIPSHPEYPGQYCPDRLVAKEDLLAAQITDLLIV
jgi:hypothetical protein